jgi:hypothetical protein
MIKANYTEDTVSLALQIFLSVFQFPRLGVTIELFSKSKERWLGSDARIGKIEGFRPFYMQFKRPYAYLPSSGSRIIKDRRSLGLNNEPLTLFFGLQPKSKIQNDFQHNILYRLGQRLQNRNLGDAAYVCPLFLERQGYLTLLHQAASEFRANSLDMFPPSSVPFILEQFLINQANGEESIRFGQIPVFPQHVSIPPHEAVQDANHKYSFTESGDGVCFHSPKKLPDGPLLLSQWLKNMSREFLKEKSMIKADAAGNELKKLIEATEIEIGKNLPDQTLWDKNGIEAWLSFGEFLRDTYEIEQYAFITMGR